jgi:DNA-binding response OmpR family regulator
MRTILVADDDEDLLRILDFSLSQSGYSVEKAKDGTETIVKVRELKPDLVLLDIMMPDVDGFSACRQLKNKEGTKHIPIIMLTAKGKAEDIKTAFKAGANDYIVKPFMMEKLLGKIEKLLKPRAERDTKSSFHNPQRPR